MGGMYRWAALLPLVAAFAAAFAFAGCDGGDGPADEAKPPVTPTWVPAPTTAVRSRVPVPVTPSAAPFSPPPFPLDGDNVAACADGKCQVRVRRGVTISVGPGKPQFTVTRVVDEDSADDGVWFDVGPPGDAYATLHLGGSRRRAPFGGDSNFEIRLRLVEQSGTTAIIEVSPLSTSGPLG
jgi:hypothetical protein